jgi:hypothetical protein
MAAKGLQSDLDVANLSKHLRSIQTKSVSKSFGSLETLKPLKLLKPVNKKLPLALQGFISGTTITKTDPNVKEIYTQQLINVYQPVANNKQGFLKSVYIADLGSLFFKNFFHKKEWDGIELQKVVKNLFNNPDGLKIISAMSGTGFNDAVKTIFPSATTVQIKSFRQFITLLSLTMDIHYFECINHDSVKNIITMCLQEFGKHQR